MPEKKVIIGVTGSIAAYKACELIGLFKKSGYDVTCVTTKEAEYFITPLTLETLSQNKVMRDMFELPENKSPQHVSLADRADLIVIYPASCNIMAKIAGGICDDLLTCTVISSKAPVLFAPAMNDNMYKHKFTARNLKTLKDAGYYFAGPVEGRLACGHTAIGHVAAAADVFAEAKKILK